MTSRVAKSTQQDPDRHDDPHAIGDTGTESKENDVKGTNQTLLQQASPQVSAQKTAPSNHVKQRDTTKVKPLDRATPARTNAKTLHSSTSIRDDRELSLTYNRSKDSYYRYFPHASQLSSLSLHNSYYRPYYYPPHNRETYLYYHQRCRPRSSLYNTSSLQYFLSDHHHNSMAPFDDTTLATSNTSKNKIESKSDKRSLTINTGTNAENHMNGRRTEECSRPNHSRYDRNPAPHPVEVVNRPHEQHFKFSDYGYEYEYEHALTTDHECVSPYEYDHEYEYDFAYSTTPIAANTPQRIRNRNEEYEQEHEERRSHLNANHLVHDNGDEAKLKDAEKDSGYRKEPPRFPYGHVNQNYGHNFVLPPSRTPSKINPNSKICNSRSTSTFAPPHPPRVDRGFATHASSHYHHSGWYNYPYEYPPQAYHHPQEPYDRRYFSPSPPPPHPDYYTSSGMFSPRVGSPTMSWYDGAYGSFDEHDTASRRPLPQYPSYPSTNDGNRFYPNPLSPVPEDRQRPRTPSSDQSVKRTIPEVTPARKVEGAESPSTSNISCIRTNHSIVTPGERKSDTWATASSASTFQPSSPFGTLRDSDIVCGRGAPTNHHVGNSQFRELVQGYSRSYYVAKRSEKPNIAIEILEVLSSRGARFVRRIKGGSSVKSRWEEVAKKIAYEKVCQALRDTSEFQSPASDSSLSRSKQAIKQHNLAAKKKNYHRHQQQEQQRGDGFREEAK